MRSGWFRSRSRRRTRRGWRCCCCCGGDDDDDVVAAVPFSLLLLLSLLLPASLVARAAARADPAMPAPTMTRSHIFFLLFLLFANDGKARLKKRKERKKGSISPLFLACLFAVSSPSSSCQRRREASKKTFLALVANGLPPPQRPVSGTCDAVDPSRDIS